MLAKAAAIAATVVIVILVLVGGLFYYSYTQLNVSLNDVRFHSIDWTTFSWFTLVNLGLNVLTGNWLGAAFELIDGVNLNLIFGLSNNGFLPVYIPNLSYDILVNGAYVGSGFTYLDATIYPGETREITALQNFQKSSLSPAVSSIVSKGGIMEINVKGTASFKLLGLSIPIPFESSKTISIQNEIKNKINAEIQKHEEEERRAAAARAAAAAAVANAAAKTLSTVGQTIYNVAKSLQDQLFGSPDDLDLDLPGHTFVDTVIKVSPGDYAARYISVDCNGNLQGGFIASAALGDNIRVYILDEKSFKQFKKGERVSTLYNSMKVESGVFDVRIGSEKHHIILDNRYSDFSTKSVQLQASVDCI